MKSQRRRLPLHLSSLPPTAGLTQLKNSDVPIRMGLVRIVHHGLKLPVLSFSSVKEGVLRFLSPLSSIRSGLLPIRSTEFHQRVLPFFGTGFLNTLIVW